MQYELAKRSDDGITVRLLWDALHDQVIVRYRDARSGDAFVAHVPKSQALSAFQHPNAYRGADLAAAV